MGKRIRIAREFARYQQQKLAEILGVSVDTLYRWETTDRQPPADKLQRIADILDVDIDYLLNKQEEFRRSKVADVVTKPDQQLVLTSAPSIEKTSSSSSRSNERAPSMLRFQVSGEWIELPPSPESYAIVERYIFNKAFGANTTLAQTPAPVAQETVPTAAS